MSDNNMMCDLTTGICGEAGDDEMEIFQLTPSKKTVDLYYVTDPICSHCWALEPVFRRFTEQYGQYFKLHTIMGGLLESWNGFADVKNTINKPSDVASHWKEVGAHSRMPIDGSLWLTNPIQSSYPPSRVFKCIQRIDANLANVYLRRLREAVFVDNQNVAEEAVLIDIVSQLNLNGEEIVKQSFRSEAKEWLEEDFELVSQLGVRGFPTIVMMNEENKGVKIVGARALDNYVAGLKQALGVEELKPKQLPSLASLLAQEKVLFSKEIEVMYDIEQSALTAFAQEELPPGSYEVKEVLGELLLTLCPHNKEGIG
ncbi:DsbA family protein [Paenibacillus sp. strain BS8-2]